MPHRTVVTGGSGVIGESLVRRLRGRGDVVRVVDLLARPDDLPVDVEYIQGDINDLGPDAIASFDPTVVFHLAAAFERSEEVPGFWRENAHHNVATSAIVLEGATRAPNLQRYAFASSYLIYDPALYLSAEPRDEAVVLHEHSPIRPRNACGAAKLLHELEIELATADPEASFSAVCARIYRVYGPSSRDVVSRWIRAALRSEPISVFGDQSRFDYVFSDDVAEALLRLSESEATGVVNVASGRARTVRELVSAVEAHFPDLQIEDRVPADIYESSEASLAQLEHLTGWTPATELELGVSELVAHERANLEANRVSRRVKPPSELNTLVTSVSAKAHIPLALRRAFEALNVDGLVWGGDVDPLATARSTTDRFWEMPPLSQLPVDDLVAFCARERIGLVVPTRDAELAYFARHRDALRVAGIFVPIGDESSIAVCNDKVRFADEMTRAGLPAIPTTDTLNSIADEIVVVKERFGAGSATAAIGVDHSRAEQVAAGLSDPIFQPYIEGKEFSIDTYRDRHGRVLGAIVRERVRVAHGESQVTTPVDDSDLREVALACTEAAAVRGHAVVQAIRNASAVYLLECNSRVGGASSAAWLNGLRSVDAMVLEALGEDSHPVAALGPHATVTRTRSDHPTWA